MTSKTIIIGLVAVAFVAGSILTGTMASAEKGGVGDNLIVDALNGIAVAITGIKPNVTVDPTPITINAPRGEKGDTGTKGDKGDTGAKGDTGDIGAIQTYTVNAFALAEFDGFVEVRSSCANVDDLIISGGYHIVNPTAGGIIYSDIIFNQEYTVKGHQIPAGLQVATTIVCLDITP